MECRLDRGHRVALAADHEAVAELTSPDAARDARVDEVDTALRRHGGTTL
jgi:hypothetical protein